MQICGEEKSVDLIKQDQAGKGGVERHADGVDLQEIGAVERGGEETATDDELPGIDRGQTEVVGCHKEERGGAEQSHNGRTQTTEHRLHGTRVHVLKEHAADENHEDKRRQYKGERGGETAQYRQSVAVASIVYGGVAAIRGGVDAYRSRRHLTDSHDVGELRRGEPPVVVYHLGLDERQHAVASAESEETNLEECYEQRKENHMLKVLCEE